MTTDGWRDVEQEQNPVHREPLQQSFKGETPLNVLIIKHLTLTTVQPQTSFSTQQHIWDDPAALLEISCCHETKSPVTIKYKLIIRLWRHRLLGWFQSVRSSTSPENSRKATSALVSQVKGLPLTHTGVHTHFPLSVNSKIEWCVNVTSPTHKHSHTRGHTHHDAIVSRL